MEYTNVQNYYPITASFYQPGGHTLPLHSHIYLMVAMYFHSIIAMLHREKGLYEDQGNNELW